MPTFIELHYQDCEMCFNLNHILRFTPVSNGKKTCLTLIDNSSVVVEEPYAEVKQRIADLMKF